MRLTGNYSMVIEIKSTFHVTRIWLLTPPSLVQFTMRNADTKLRQTTEVRIKTLDLLLKPPNNDVARTIPTMIDPILDSATQRHLYTRPGTNVKGSGLSVSC